MRKIYTIIIVLIISCLVETVFGLSRIEPVSWSDIYYKKADIALGWKYIIIHHSATSSGSAKAFHKYHTDQGYGGLCYHFVIGNGHGSPDGNIEGGKSRSQEPMWM